MFGKKREGLDASKSGAATSLRDGATEGPAARPAAMAPVGRPAEAARRVPEMPAPPRRAADPAKATAEEDSRRLIVGRGIVLKGEIGTCDRLVVEGRVEASLTDCRSIEIAEPGSFKGTAQIDSADVSGHFDGELTVKDRLVVRATGRITGKIRYGAIEVERGGVLSGTVEVLRGAALAAESGATARSSAEEPTAPPVGSTAARPAL